mgnify:CR=1 FL=1
MYGHHEYLLCLPRHFVWHWYHMGLVGSLQGVQEQPEPCNSNSDGKHACISLILVTLKLVSVGGVKRDAQSVTILPSCSCCLL